MGGSLEGKDGIGQDRMGWGWEAFFRSGGL